jgi:glycosyltransferase EpsD
MGWEVTAIALPVSKRFFSIKNLRAINDTRKILNCEEYDVISSHATLAGIVTRLAVMLLSSDRKNRMKVFHTVHGYLFHDNRNPKKWAYLLPEKLCGLLTDVLMVMNHEDLEIAKKYRLCKDSCRIFYIDGMGIDLSRFSPGHASSEQRKSFGINENDFTFLYAAEFSVRKNHELLIRGFAEALKKLNELKMNGVLPAGLPVDRLKLVLAGDGALFNKMNALTAELKISDKIIFLGHMKNMNELYPCCDAAVTTSRIEGLPFNVMEAMACGLPVIASDIKGHRELIVHGKNGLLFKDGEQHHLADYLIEIYKNTALREDFSAACVEKVKAFSIDKTLPMIMEIYDTNI